MKSRLLQARMAVVLVIFGTLTNALRAAEVGPTSEDLDFFEKKIRPVLVERCFECHSAGAKILKSGLRLDSAAGMLRGGEGGAVVVPGDVENSRMIRAIRFDNPDLQMPPRNKLSPRIIADFEAWVAMGSPYPALAPETENPKASPTPATALWVTSPLVPTAPPTVKQESWVRTPVDAFILARLEETGVAPAKPADKRTLLRRATFDLTGLPPTEEQLRAFLADDKPNAFERVVDSLLASPAYGERWGRHWLDVARYTDSLDTRGMFSPGDITPIWRYRDWVVNAFNNDYPYDRFITDQLAGDILSARSPTGLDEPRLIATGLLALGEWGAGDSDKRKMMTDIVDDQIDVVGRSILGLTISCARCHDHKFDPISTREYYALAGFFFSSHIIAAPGDPTQGTPVQRIPLLTRDQKADRKEAQEKLDAATRAMESLLASRRTELGAELKNQVARYLSAVGELAAGTDGADPDRLALKHQLNAAMLKKWLAYVGLPDGSDPVQTGLFNERFTQSFGSDGVWGWRQSGVDLPAATVYPGDAPKTILTFTLPPRSVSLHPSPQRASAAAWESPVSGEARISGRVADADAAGGNGFTWSLELSRNNVRQRLAGGVVANGQSQELPQESLKAVGVQPGDRVCLIIEPTGTDHVCDTTVVDVTLTVNNQKWNLTADVLKDPDAPHPIADAYGNAGVWSFYSQVNGRLTQAAAEADSPFGRWLVGLKQGLGLESLELLAADVSQSLAGPTPSDPLLHYELTAADGYFLKTFDIATTLSGEAKSRLTQLQMESAAMRARLAGEVVPAVGIQEGGVPGSEHEGTKDARLHLRGDYNRQSEVVPRGFPALFGGQTPAIEPGGSGRLELAKWVVDAENGAGRQAARVAVNRIWQQHFGRGLVATPDNFGTLGSPPTHRLLMDDLALAFIASGWSHKAMHKRIMLSATYQQSSTAGEQTHNADPENRLFSRMDRRRLDVEAIRDSLLAISGRLDTTLGGESVVDYQSPRRTLYITSVRSNRSTFRQLFDGADTAAIIARRNESTVAPQSLFMLNNPFVLAQTQALAERITQQNTHDADRIARLYEWLYARPPTPQEVAIGLRFVAPPPPAEGEHSNILKNVGMSELERWAAYCQVLLCANEFVYID